MAALMHTKHERVDHTSFEARHRLLDALVRLRFEYQVVGHPIGGEWPLGKT